MPYAQLHLTGEPVFKFATMKKQWPAHAGTWNHRLEAVYRASEEAPHHQMVSPVLTRGLRSVKFVDPRVPDHIWESFITTHNQFHQGSSASFKEYLEEALKLEASWEVEVSRTGISCQNPRYRQEYKDHVLRKSSLPAQRQ